MENGNGHSYGDDDPTPPTGGAVPFSEEALELVRLALQIGSAAAGVWKVARAIDTVGGDKRRIAVAECAATITDLIEAAYAARTAVNTLREDR
jgi:hypothetical protein